MCHVIICSTDCNVTERPTIQRRKDKLTLLVDSMGLHVDSDANIHVVSQLSQNQVNSCGPDTQNREVDTRTRTQRYRDKRHRDTEIQEDCYHLL